VKFCSEKNPHFDFTEIIKKERKKSPIDFKHATIRFGSLRAELVADAAIEEQQ